MKTDRISRRKFLQNTAVTTTMASLIPLGISNNAFAQQPVNDKPPREVWIAGLSQMGLYAKTPELMTEKILEILKEVIPYQPDFVCLPEAFVFSNVERKFTVAEKLQISENVLEQFAEFSKRNNCYTICPVYTSSDGKIYNSAVVFSREGEKIGIYNKIHETEEEIFKGITPGSLLQPVIQTDFGPIGIQICFDIQWDDGWKMLREQGAKIIFWPSAFAGGKMVNTKAWQHKCVVTSSSNGYTSKLCDISGETIAQTGIWDKNLFCAPVNLEKVFLNTWPYVLRFNDIQNKYGRKVRITNFHEEEWSIIESLSPDIFVKDILKEFDLKTHEEHIESAEKVQNKART
ncbi:MAG: carbon-nitrogen hydrolase family protein [Bacteroidales bacterium]|nr:carbon-nitrogen hydrolase family protein [Bacteroidales bacterium]